MLPALLTDNGDKCQAAIACWFLIGGPWPGIHDVLCSLSPPGLRLHHSYDLHIRCTRQPTKPAPLDSVALRPLQGSTVHAMSSPLPGLPDEVIQVILSYLPPTSNAALQQTCRHFANVANEPLVWKTYCQETYKYWDLRHAFQTKLKDVSFTGWKDFFAQRHQTSRTTRNALDKIVNEELGRLDSIRVILEAGYDAKQDLLDMFWNAPSSRNHLAQR